MNTNDFIQKVLGEFDQKFYATPNMKWGIRVHNVETGEAATWREKAHTFIERAFLEHEKLIREEERERILAALPKLSNDIGNTINATEGAFEPSEADILVEETWNNAIKAVRAALTPDSEKGKCCEKCYRPCDTKGCKKEKHSDCWDEACGCHLKSEERDSKQLADNKDL